ncbi:MAG: hypothetical protein L3J76_04485 [Candidatus Hydrothermae bacterium]|nr:hypothetical protein [Candidatus Hydrothermae bacterium]
MIWILLVGLATAPLTWEDTLKFAGVVEVLPAVEVQAPAWGWQHTLPPVREALPRALEATGVDLIRRGPAFAADLFVDGFRRSDLPIVMDGQHVYNACPNRMDVPLVRVNPLEVKSTRIVLQSADMDAGLGGVFRVVRRTPSREFQPLGYLQVSGGAERGMDGGMATELGQQGLYARYTRAQPYTDALGRTFQTLYGYRPDVKDAYRVSEVSFRGQQGSFQYGLSIASYRDVLFPYLLMDERDNRGGEAFVEWQGHRLYANAFRHQMDNGLRIAAARMAMATDARTLVVGMKKEGLYDLVVRRWISDNTMDMTMNGMPMTLSQRMLDLLDVRVSTGMRYTLNEHTQLRARVGLERVSREDGRLDLLRLQESSVARVRWMPLTALSLQRSLGRAKVLLEGALEAVDPEYLYMELKRPPMNGMPRPFWVGRTSLAQPFKVAARLRWPVSHRGVSLVGETFVHHVWNYVEPARRTVQSQPLQTYASVNALMAGVRLQGRWRMVEGEAHYTWAQNRTAGVSLSEVPPLHVRLEVRPSWQVGSWRLLPSLAVTYEARQDRINPDLGETPTPAWMRVDAGLGLTVGGVHLQLRVENLTNELYFRHLSYLRSPFQSGVRVYEPGRRFTLSVWAGS